MEVSWKKIKKYFLVFGYAIKNELENHLLIFLFFKKFYQKNID